MFWPLEGHVSGILVVDTKDVSAQVLILVFLNFSLEISAPTTIPQIEWSILKTLEKNKLPTFIISIQPLPDTWTYYPAVQFERGTLQLCSLKCKKTLFTHDNFLFLVWKSIRLRQSHDAFFFLFPLTSSLWKIFFLFLRKLSSHFLVLSWLAFQT